MSNSDYKRKLRQFKENSEQKNIKQNTVPSIGQKYEDAGCGFVIKQIVGPFALCQLTNAKIKRIPLKDIPTYKLITNIEDERPKRKFRFGMFYDYEKVYNLRR